MSSKMQKLIKKYLSASLISKENKFLSRSMMSFFKTMMSQIMRWMTKIVHQVVVLMTT